jgi:hypothetical protein
LERSVHMLRSCAHVCAGSDRHMAHASIGALLVHGPCDPLGFGLV